MLVTGDTSGAVAGHHFIEEVTDDLFCGGGGPDPRSPSPQKRSPTFSMLVGNLLCGGDNQ
ncbi:hypothetical protein CDL15_Pgr025923 [Punica granatum]|nr:hypothetical protein CDL15_Pgr025923 [Punica granatum]